MNQRIVGGFFWVKIQKIEDHQICGILKVKSISKIEMCNFCDIMFL